MRKLVILFKMFLNDKEVRGELNMKADVKPGVTQKIDIGTFDLQEGEQVIKLNGCLQKVLGVSLCLTLSISKGYSCTEDRQRPQSWAQRTQRVQLLGN